MDLLKVFYFASYICHGAADMFNENAGIDIVAFPFGKIDVDGDAVAYAYHEAMPLVIFRLGVHPIERGCACEPEVDGFPLAVIFDVGGGINLCLGRQIAQTDEKKYKKLFFHKTLILKQFWLAG